MTPTTDEIRAVYDYPIKLNTHWDGCWQTHFSCTIAMLCDELDALRKQVEIAERLRPLVVTGLRQAMEANLGVSNPAYRALVKIADALDQMKGGE